ncbi:hypothetical protein [Maribacter sp. 2-571]|uniref:hypothetical protein n=1 Tax=Maribacter sp. 2-571 TaxID=3417569 RepID=UPI003D357D5B
MPYEGVSATIKLNGRDFKTTAGTKGNGEMSDSVFSLMSSAMAIRIKLLGI